MPEISIITPAYIDTPEKVTWLKETIESVRDQDFTDWEMVIVDDCSPLGLDIPADARIKVARTVRQSFTPLCRNTAAALASGAGLLALDADDQLPPGALEELYRAWNADRSRVVYGDLQRLELGSEGYWRLGKVVNFPDYDFQRSLDFRGTIHVSALHSKEAHVKSGGWKSELEAGLEDIEYWISCGLAGFCGRHLNTVTLYYRRHTGSRTQAMRRVNRREGEMRSIIYQMHEDIYEGRNYPMACCGKGSGSRVNRVAGSQPPPTAAPRATSLDQFSGDEKVWIEYKGKRSASFGVRGTFTGLSYKVEATGHKLEVHTQDLPIFRRAGRGKDFLIGVTPPTGQASPQAPADAPAGPEYQPPAPEVTTIERVPGSVAAAQPEPVVMPEVVTEPGESYALDLLDLDKMLVSKLGAVGWTILSLSQVDDVGELTKIKGVGPVRAAQIIGKAREYLEAHGG